MCTCIEEAWSGLSHLSWCGGFQPPSFLPDKRRGGVKYPQLLLRQAVVPVAISTDLVLVLTQCWSSQASSPSETVGKKVKQRTSKAAKLVIQRGLQSLLLQVELPSSAPSCPCTASVPSERLLPQTLLQCRWKMSLIFSKERKV